MIEELLASKKEPWDVEEQPHAEDRGVETPTHAESSRDGRKCTRMDDSLLHDYRENVGALTSQHRKRSSPERYNHYMALMRKCVETDPSFFEEEVQ